VQVSLWKKDTNDRFVDTGLKQTTGADRRDEFSTSLGLSPGEYQVVESQPAGLFHGGQVVGSVGGDSTIADLISGIVLLAGVDAVAYDFPEFPPATIQGHVFRDGGPIRLASPLQAASLRPFRDGVFTVDDHMIGNVVLELRNVLSLLLRLTVRCPELIPMVRFEWRRQRMVLINSAA